MGWTYDWGNSERNHAGVAEFIVRPDAAIKVLREHAPARFCAKPN